MDIGIKFTDNKLYEYEFYIANKLKAYLYNKRYFTNIIGKRVSFDLIFPITPIGYNSSKGYISQTDYKSYNIDIKLIKTKDKAADYVIQ